MEENFTLQLLHHADFEGNTNAIEDAPRLAALFDYFDNFHVGNTLKLSGGDNWIPSPWYNSQVSEISALTEALQNVYETTFNLSPGSLSGLTVSPGVIDQAIVNIIGIDASTLGNHEFDQGADDVARIIEMTINGQLDQVATTDITNIGTLFPYITANLDFADSELAGAASTVAQAIEDISVRIAGDADVDTPAEIQALIEQDRIAPSTWVEVGGEKIGIVGATTQRLAAISSPGDVEVIGATDDDMAVLAAQVQAQVDALLATHTDMNKVVLISHLQDYQNEAELATLLSGVDIILSAGSDAIFADETDVIRDGQTVSENVYPLVHTGADNNPVLQINTDGQYQYMGRLVVEFDTDGVVLVDSINADDSGAYAATDAVVSSLYGEADPYAEGSIGGMVKELADAVDSVIGEKLDNVAGYTDVYLNGARGSVRNEETNFGNLTADANLAAGRFYIENNPEHYQDAPLVSLKNGGGIRSDIGLALGVSGPEAPVGGAVTQLDIETALAFNNGLAIVETTAQGLVTLLEHGVANAGTTSGRFPQVGGMSFSYDTDNEPGSRLVSLQLNDDQGNPGLVIMADGELAIDPQQPVNIVSLDFLALNDGDGYPFSEVASQISALVTADPKTFGTPFTEQDALYDYLQANHGTPDTAFTLADTDQSGDTRLQNLNEREDTVADMSELELVGLTPIGTYATGVFDESAAEIIAFDPATDRMFLVSAAAAEIQVLDYTDPTKPTLIGRLDMSSYGEQVNSVDVKNGLVAVAVAGAKPQTGGAHPNGNIVLFDTDVALSGSLEAPVGAQSFEAGAGPDMVTFTPDGTKILSANEGEAINEGWTGAGSVTIVTLGANGVSDATAQTIGFEAWNGREGELRERGVRIADGISASEDLEPEYIAVSEDGTQAVVTLQENNALAYIDLTGENPTIVDVVPMGYKNHERGDLEMIAYGELEGDALPTLGTDANGNEIPVGGFSGLHYTGTAQDGNLQFVTVSDRGPNGSPADVDSDSANERPFLLPDYQARVTNLEFNPTTGAMTIGDTILLKDADGNPITGLPNIAGVDEEPVEVTTDGFNAISYDPLGADLEGIYVDSTGGMWMVDEYRPSVYHFDSTGTLVNRFIPEGTHALAGLPAPAIIEIPESVTFSVNGQDEVVMAGDAAYVLDESQAPTGYVMADQVVNGASQTSVPYVLTHDGEDFKLSGYNTDNGTFIYEGYQLIETPTADLVWDATQETVTQAGVLLQATIADLLQVPAASSQMIPLGFEVNGQRYEVAGKSEKGEVDGVDLTNAWVYATDGGDEVYFDGTSLVSLSLSETTTPFLTATLTDEDAAASAISDPFSGSFSSVGSFKQTFDKGPGTIGVLGEGVGDEYPGLNKQTFSVGNYDIESLFNANFPLPENFVVRLWSNTTYGEDFVEVIDLDSGDKYDYVRYGFLDGNDFFDLTIEDISNVTVSTLTENALDVAIATDSVYGTETLPEHLSDRQANRGFEALAVDEANGKLYAFLQSPLDNAEGDSDVNGALIRIVEMSIAEGSMGEATAEYAYVLERPALNSGDVDKIGDAVFNAETGTIFVFERDSAQGQESKKVLYEINLDGATDLLTADVTLPEGKTTLEELTVDELLAAGINPVYKEMVGNLSSMGYTPNDKAEGLALLGDGRMAVINDNDFGVNGTGTETIGLGLFEFNGANSLDTNRDDDQAELTSPKNLLGAYMPDAVASFMVDGKAFYITANEGDSRDIDESRLKNVENLDENLVTDAHEDLTVLTDMIDVDGDGDIDRLVAFGGRSASIFDGNGNRVWDSGNLFEMITKEALPEQFNATNDKSGIDARSDDKGPEPEGVSIAQMGNNIYAIVTLERIGGVVILDVTDPYAPEYVNYVNNRDFAADPESALAGDLGPESSVFISEDDSPTGEAMVAVANEVSGTVTNFAVQTALGTQLFGTSGHDTLTATVEGSQIYGYEGDDHLIGSSGDDQLFGGSGADTLEGGDGNDTLFGGDGDTFDGGAGIDTVVLSVSGDMSVTLGDGGYVVDGEYQGDLISVENLTLSGGDGYINGSDDDNRIDIREAGDVQVYGLGGDDAVHGLSGGDMFIGGAGHDTAYFDGAKSDYQVRSATPAELTAMELRVDLEDTFGVYAITAVDAPDATAFVQAETLMFGDGNQADLVFIESAQGLISHFANDLQDDQILMVKNGADLGSVFDLTVTAENVTVILDDTIGTPRFYLADDVVSFSLEGTGDGNIYGNSLDNVLHGNDGNNRIDGRGGDDTLVGKGGDDYLLGRSGHDIIVAGEGADIVSAGSGDDVIYAMDGGADELIAGSGDDMVFVSNGESTILAGSGIDLVQFVGGDQDTSIDALLGDLSASDVLDLSALSVESLADHTTNLVQGDLEVALEGFVDSNGDPIEHNMVFAANTETSVDAAMARMGEYDAPHDISLAQLAELNNMSTGLVY